MGREPGDRAHDSLTGDPATKYVPCLMNLGVISLGCDKATVDSERLVGDLVGHGAKVVPDR